MANDVKIIISAVDKASSTLKKVSGELDKVGKSGDGFKALAANAKTAWTALGVGIGVAVSVGGAIKKIADDTMKYAFEVKDFGRIIGASAEEASKLIQVADDVRLSTESMTTAMRAAITKGYNPTIEGLGQMSDEYNRLAPGIERSRFLIETFGRSGLEMAKLMELGSKRIKEMGDSIEGTGLLMTEEGIKKAEEYYRAIDNLTDAWTGLKMNAGAVTLPIVIKVVEALSGSPVAVDDRIKRAQEDAKRALKAEVINRTEYQHIIGLTASGTEQLAKAEQMLAAAGVKLTNQVEERKTAYDDIRSQTLALVEAQYKLNEETGNFGAALLGSSGAATDMVNSLAKVHSAMIGINNAVGDMQFDKLKTQLQIDAGINFKFPDITSELANWLKKDKWTAAGGDFVLQAYLDLQPRMATSGADVREKLAKEIGALELAVKVEVGEISKDEARRMFMDAFGGSYKDAATAIDVAAKIDTTSVDTIKKDLKNDDFLAPLKPEVDQAALSMARAEMGKPITVKLVPVGGGGGGGSRTLTKYEAWQEISSGVDINGNGLIGKALGGPVSARRPYIVGERGPELFVPSQAGEITPNNKLGGGSYVDVGGIYINGGGQSPQAIAQAVIAQLNRSMRAARQSGLGYVGS